MSGDAYCTASSVKTGRRLSGCSKGGRLRASNKASKVYRERVDFADMLTSSLLNAYTSWGDIYWKEFSIYFTVCYLGQLGLGFLVLYLIFLLISLSLFLVIGLAN